MRKNLSLGNLPTIDQEYTSLMQQSSTKPLHSPKNISLLNAEVQSTNNNGTFEVNKNFAIKFLINNPSLSTKHLRDEPSNQSQQSKELPSIFNTKKMLKQVEKSKRLSVIDKDFKISRQSFVHNTDFLKQRSSLLSHISNLQTMKKEIKQRTKSELSFLVNTTNKFNDTTFKHAPQIDKFQSCLFYGKGDQMENITRQSGSIISQNDTLQSLEDHVYTWNFVKKDIAEKYKYSVNPNDEQLNIRNTDKILKEKQIERQALKMRLIINKNHVNFVPPHIKKPPHILQKLDYHLTDNNALSSPQKKICTNELLQNLMERYPKFIPEKKEVKPNISPQVANIFSKQTTFSKYQQKVNQLLNH